MLSVWGHLALLFWVQGPFLLIANAPTLRRHKGPLPRPLQTAPSSLGRNRHHLDMEERPASYGHQTWVGARFGDFITPWIEERQLELSSSPT
jgi:hypothetical protein